MKVEERDVTPEIAKEMLKRNANNRKCNDRHVSFLAREMVMNNWLFDGQPIRFSEGGTLLDGQHRLTAIIESETTQKFLILTGVDREAFKVMDTGRARNTGDAFGIHGIANSTLTAAATRFIMSHQDNTLRHNLRMSNTDVLSYYMEHQDISKFATKGITLYKAFNKVLTSSVLVGMMYLTAKKNVVKSEDFWSKVCHGLALEKGDPALILRNKLMTDKMNTTSLPIADKIAVIIKAWNLYRQDKTCKFLRWDKDREDFPVIM